MVLNEAPSERVQQTWYARLAQERRELSVSVEEALVNAPWEESFWLDDQSQCATIVGTGKSHNVFPPRLSLQSRALPGVSARVGTGLVNRQSATVQHTNIWTRFVRRLKSSLSALRFHSSVATTPALSPNESSSMQSAQVEDVVCPAGGTSDASDSQVLSTDEVSSKSEYRVVTGPNVRYGASRSVQGRQRLAGRTTRIRLEVVPASSSGPIPDEASPSHRVGAAAHPCPEAAHPYPAMAHRVGAAARPYPAAFHAHNDPTGSSMTRPDIATFGNKSGTSVCLPAIEKVIRRPVEEDRTLVGGDRGTTGMRLPAVEQVIRRPVEEDRTLVGGDRGTTGMRLPAVEQVIRRPVEEDRTFVDGDRGTTGMRLPAIEQVIRRPVEEDRTFVDGDRGTTGMRLPAIEQGTGRRKEPSPTWRAGTGKFAYRQRDVTISEPSVTASSVVIVTLTANPGPVVVQYVSLQPGRGFTVHLTAPTAIGAPFNYVVLGVA